MSDISAPERSPKKQRCSDCMGEIKDKAADKPLLHSYWDALQTNRKKLEADTEKIEQDRNNLEIARKNMEEERVKLAQEQKRMEAERITFEKQKTEFLASVGISEVEFMSQSRTRGTENGMRKLNTPIYAPYEQTISRQTSRPSQMPILVTTQNLTLKYWSVEKNST